MTNPLNLQIPTLQKTLPNGLTLLLREAHAAPVAELQIWAKVGSADETAGEEGLAHFHEHMLFKGTKRRGLGEVAGEIEGAGGHINAFTSFDVTVYHATLPSDALATGLDVLVDALRFSIFDPGEIEREVEVVLEEIRRAQDTPGDVLGDALFSTVFPNHPYGRPILGPPENVARFDREQVMRFFERWYTPNHLMVVAVGDFDAQELASQIGAAFADAKPGPAHKRKRSAEPIQRALRSQVLTRPFQRAHLEIAFPSIGFAHPDTPLLDLLAFILGEGESSRLVRELKERDGLVDQIHASCYTPLDPGIFGISAIADPAQCDDALRAVCAHTERLRRERVQHEELERARINFLSSESFERESVSGTAHKLGNFQVLCDDYRAEERYLECIRSATPEALRAVARSYLQPAQMTIAAILPEIVPEGPKPLDQQTISTIVEQSSTTTSPSLFLPKRSESSPSRKTIHSYELANGASIHVYPRRDVPVVAVRAAFLGGLLAELDPVTQAGISLFHSRMLTRGTLERDAAAFARKAEGLAADIDGFSGRSSSGLTLDAPTHTFSAALDLFAEALCSRAFSLQEIEREQREILAALARREDDLPTLAFDLFRGELFGSHPYHRPVLGTEEAIRAINAERIAEHHRTRINAQNCVIGVAGDVDPDEVADEIASHLAGLTQSAAHPALPAAAIFPKQATRVFCEKNREQAHLVLGFPGLDVKDSDRFALEVLSQLLAGQGGRLFIELRDKQSLAYALSAGNIEGIAPGYFAIYIGTAPDKLERAEKGIRIELERILQDPIPAPELERAKRYLSGGFAIAQQRSAVRAAHIALDGLYGLGAEASLGYPKQIQAVCADDILRVAQRVLRLDKSVLAAIRP